MKNMAVLNGGGVEKRRGVQDETLKMLGTLKAYNEWAGHHEHVNGEILLSAARPYPGMGVGRRPRIAFGYSDARKRSGSGS